MKKAAFVMGVVLAAAGAATAAEFPENPDRFPSIGLNYTGIFQSGDQTVNTGAGTFSQDSDDKSNLIVADLRLPVTNSLTFNAGAGFVNSKTTFDETSSLNALESDGSGFLVNAGVRFYLK